jgi:hypothetical protein
MEKREREDIILPLSINLRPNTQLYAYKPSAHLRKSPPLLPVLHRSMLWTQRTSDE